MTARFGFVSTLEHPSWGGSENLWSQTALRLQEMGQTVSANACHWPTLPGPLERLETAGVQMHYRRSIVPTPLPRPQRAIRLLKSVLSGRPPQVPTLRDGGMEDREMWNAWLDEARPDLVIISQGYYLEGVALKQVCRQRGMPYVSLLHSAGDHSWPDDGFAELLAEGFELSLRNDFISQGLLRFVRRVLATPLENVKIIRSPYNLPSGTGVAPWPDSEETFRLASVGRLECIQKGQDILLETLHSEKWKSRPLEVTFFGDGPNRRTLERLKTMYQLENVHIGGFASDIGAIWKTHHALIMPSRYEGLPSVVVEAMLCGRPCIVTDVMGNAELLTDNVNAFVADAPTPGRLDAALERAWERRADWEQMGKAAAAAIHELMPPDPTGIYADDLLQLALAQKDKKEAR